MTNNEKVRIDVQNTNQKERSDAYIRRITEEAKLWSKWALEHSSLTRPRVHEMALDAVGFSLSHRLHALAIPTKLTGVTAHQHVLEALMDLREDFGTPLRLEAQSGRLEAWYGSSRLGALWNRHGWIWPLMSAGVPLFLIAVTGAESWKTYGCNVGIGRVAEAIRKVELGDSVPAPDSGDGLPKRASLPEPALPRSRHAAAGR